MLRPRSRALEADDDLFRRNVNAQDVAQHAASVTVLDWCGVSIPTGFDASGLPTARPAGRVRPGRDDHLLATAPGGSNP